MDHVIPVAVLVAPVPTMPRRAVYRLLAMTVAGMIAVTLLLIAAVLYFDDVHTVFTQKVTLTFDTAYNDAVSKHQQLANGSLASSGSIGSIVDTIDGEISGFVNRSTHPIGSSGSSGSIVDTIGAELASLVNRTRL